MPATSPLPGRLLEVSVTVSDVGAVPLAEESVSQLPPSEVEAVAVQSSVPVPALRIGMLCGDGLAVPVAWKKPILPGMSSK